jgi:hypothetical protein
MLECSGDGHDRAFRFLAYDPDVLKLLPEVIRHQFPLHLTRRSAIDKEALAALSFLKDGGCTFDLLAGLMKEMAMRRYYEKELLYAAHVERYNHIVQHPHRDPTTGASANTAPRYHLNAVCPMT